MAGTDTDNHHEDDSDDCVIEIPRSNPCTMVETPHDFSTDGEFPDS